MVFISITRLKVKSIFYLPQFLRVNEASANQLIKTKGFLAGKELVDARLTFWTLTMWESDVEMKSFRNSIPHRKAMQKLPHWCSDASYFHWTQNEAILPSLKEASEKLLKQGNLTKVRNPSANQISNSFPPIKWLKFERNFKALI
jgi:hypothetical protein